MSNISDALLAIVKGKKGLGQKITQVELAKELGCSQGQLSGMLRGDKPIKADMLEKFCVVLEIKLSDLENWNPELAEIRLSQSAAKALPRDLSRAQTRLARLYETNRQAFAGVVGMIDFGLKPVEAEEPAKKAQTV